MATHSFRVAKMQRTLQFSKMMSPAESAGKKVIDDSRNRAQVSAAVISQGRAELERICRTIRFTWMATILKSRPANRRD